MKRLFFALATFLLTGIGAYAVLGISEQEMQALSNGAQLTRMAIFMVAGGFGTAGFGFACVPSSIDSDASGSSQLASLLCTLIPALFWVTVLS